MRLIFGTILGMTLTVCAAFIADSVASDPSTTTGSGSNVEHRQMVNWDVVGDNMRIARERMRATWIRLSHKFAS